MKRKIGAMVIWALLIPALLTAQASRFGQLRGRILDADDKTPLYGCNIIIEGTVLGAAADHQGGYFVSRILPGTYTVVASMMGYASKKVKGVVIEAGKTAELNFVLQATVLETPQMVVTASKRRQQIQETPVSVDVVSSREIRQRNVATLDEVLVNTAGVGIIEGQLDIRGSTGFNWSAGSRVLLMVDGHPLISGETGGINWSAIPVDQVESVEIVKGAGSALYGSNAMAGMVNIITRDPGPKPETRYHLTWGFYDQPVYSEWRWTDRFLPYQLFHQGRLNLKSALGVNGIDISHSRQMGPVGLLLSVSRWQSSGYQQNGDYSRWNIMSKANIKLSRGQSLSVLADWAVDDHGDILQWLSQERALEVPQEELGNRVRNEKTNVHATYSNAITSELALKLKGNFYRTDWHNFFYDNRDYAVTDRWGGEAQLDYAKGRHLVTSGGEMIYQTADSPIYGDQSTWDGAVYTEDIIRLGGGFKANLGGRFDYHHVHGIGEDWQFSPRMGLTAGLWRGGALRLSAGRGFRAPSIAEVFANITVSGFRVVPNLNLKEAERAWSMETGLRQNFQFQGGIGFFGKLAPNGMFDLAFFYSRYTNMIDVDLNSELMAFQFINLDNARNLGFEARCSAGILGGMLLLNGGFTYIDPVNIDTGKMLNYRSRYRFTGSSTLRLGRITFGFDYRYASRVEEVVDIFATDQRVPMHVIDARVIYALGKMDLALECKNLRNYNYSLRQRYLEPLRQFVFSLRGSL